VITRLGLAIAVAALVAGCAARRGELAAPVFTQGVWLVRIDVDSAPTRRPSTKPIVGTVDFAAARYAIDFFQAIKRRLPPGAYVVALPPQQEGQPPLYKMTLGDSSSFDEKLVFLGRLVGPDSIVGTWSETILCCSAGGRFALWRTTPR
jgi:hypothetical protein